MYSIAYDEPRRLVTATLRGFWSPEMVARYAADLFAVMRRIDAAQGPFHLLARSVEMAVQPPDVSKAFSDFTIELVRLCPGRIAITVGTMLNKIQATRALAHARIQVFHEEQEALAWLLDGELQRV